MVARSMSRMPSLLPSSTWSRGSKSKARGSPTRRISTLSASSFPSGTSEDADLYARWRSDGRTVIVDPMIKSEYTPRRSPGALWKQYFRYGMGKAEMLWANRRLPSLRPLAPTLLILGLVAFAILAVVTGVWWPLAALTGAWLLWLLYVGISSRASVVGAAFAAAIMHGSYGIGLLWGLVRGPGPVRRSMGDR